MSSQGLSVGDVLPKMNTQDGMFRRLTPEKGSGRYALIQFWAAYDAPSRARMQQWNLFFGASLSDKILYHRISLDLDPDIALLTEQIDQIENGDGLAVGTLREETIDLYKLSQGMHSYLVNDQGTICAIDPTEAELERFYRS